MLICNIRRNTRWCTKGVRKFNDEYKIDGTRPANAFNMPFDFIGFSECSSLTEWISRRLPLCYHFTRIRNTHTAHIMIKRKWTGNRATVAYKSRIIVQNYYWIYTRVVCTYWTRWWRTKKKRTKLECEPGHAKRNNRKYASTALTLILCDWNEMNRKHELNITGSFSIGTWRR